MVKIVLPTPRDLEYVPNHKDIVKELGGEWDMKDMLWILPEDTELPLELEGYMLQH